MDSFGSRMECVAPLQPNLHKVIVTHWKSETAKDTYTFNDGNDKTLSIFPDDTIIKAIHKICASFGKKEIPYVWHNKQSLLFSARSDWKGYHVNPWKAEKDNNSQLKPVITHKSNGLIESISHINIVFKSDIPIYASNEHYFPDISQSFPSLQELQMENKVLETLWTVPYEEHQRIQNKEKGCNYTNISFRAVPKRIPENFHLSNMFDTLHASASVPFIQWMDHISRIMYKVYQNHNIPSNLLQLWTNVEKLPKVNSCLIMYLTLPRKSLYAKVFVDTKGALQITYHIDQREKVDGSVIKQNMEQFMKHLSTLTGITYDISENDVSFRTELKTTKTALAQVASSVSKLIPIFHTLKYSPGKIDLIYKRSSNYHNNIQVSEYIQSNIQLGISIQEIIENLLEMGLSESDVKMYVEQATNEDLTAQNTKKIDIGTFVHITNHSYGFRVDIKHAPSIAEARRCLHWIRCVILSIKTKAIAQAAVQAVQPVASPTVSPTAVSKSSTKSKTKTPSTESAESGQSSASDLDFLGGAVGKDKQRYFLNRLQEADPAIFSGTVDYARMCGVTSFRQPVVITKAQKEQLEKQGYGKNIDNTIEYGSDPSNQNVYFCPRIWCPSSEVPIAPGEKCPQGEEPIKLYEHSAWDNDPKTPHYIGFHKNKGDNGLCLPCCFKKPSAPAKLNECLVPTSTTQKQKQKKQPGKAPTSPVAVVPAKEDAYLMSQGAPLPEGRSGTVPQVIHEIILPDVSYQLCAKALSTQECLARRGMGQSSDALLDAIAYTLKMPSKKKLVQHIIKLLDPYTFVQLENGNVLFAFAPNEAIIPKQNQQLKQLLKHLETFPKYVDRFGLQDVVEACKDLSNASVTTKYRVSRELSILHAYNGFISYLQSDEVKNPHHLFDLLKRVGYLLVLWDRNQSDQITLQCPYFANLKHLLAKHENSRKTIMLMRDGPYYEPIELKKRNQEGTPVIDTNYTTKLDSAFAACDANDIEQQVVNSILALQRWIQSMLFSPKPLLLSKAVIGPDYRIKLLITNNGTIIKIPNKGISVGNAYQLPIQSFVYHEDIQGQSYTITVLSRDFDLFANKLNTLGYGYDLGRLINVRTELNTYQTILVIPPAVETPVIYTAADDEQHQIILSADRRSKRWRELQVLVSKTFIAHYDTLVKPLLKKRREERVHILMNTFPSIPEKKKLQVIIEEIPFEHGYDALVNWARNVGAQQNYTFFTPEIKEVKKEWVFSQNAIDAGIPNFVLFPFKGARPDTKYTPDVSNDDMVKLTRAQPSVVGTVDAVDAVDMLDLDHVQRQSLPSKWTQIKAYEWAKYKVWQRKAYTRNSLPSLLKWISQNIHVPFVWEDVQYMRNKHVFMALKDKESMLVLLEDPSFLALWMKAFNKSYKQPKQIWERCFEKTPMQQTEKLWLENMNSDMIWPMDIDLYHAAVLLDCTILLILNRSKYGASEGDRGALSDLSMSSALYASKYQESHLYKRPLIILYKETNKDAPYATYSVVVNDQQKFLYSSLKECPKDIEKLVEYHLQHRSFTF